MECGQCDKMHNHGHTPKPCPAAHTPQDPLSSTWTHQFLLPLLDSLLVVLVALAAALKHPTSIHLLDQKKDGAVQVREQTARLDHLLKEVPEPAPRLNAAVSDAVGNGEQTRSGTPLPALWFGQPDPNNQETRRNQHYHQPWHCFRPIEHAWLLFMFLFISFSPSAHTPSWHLSTTGLPLSQLPLQCFFSSFLHTYLSPHCSWCWVGVHALPGLQTGLLPCSTTAQNLLSKREHAPLQGHIHDMPERSSHHHVAEQIHAPDKVGRNFVQCAVSSNCSALLFKG
jgi:hypothetical protein